MRYLPPAGPAFGPLAGLFILGAIMAIEPPVKRTIAFFDGQNLFHHAKAAFGHTYPNFDPGKLTGSICSSRDWAVSGIHFYTGVPSSMDKPIWIRIDRATYDVCIDPNDYRPKGAP